MKTIYREAYHLLCGDKLGNGIHRDVYACVLRPELVVKIENDTDLRVRSFANMREWQFWLDWQHDDDVARWLAPCETISPDGKILLQRRVEPIPRDYKLPKTLPAFLTDTKRQNFGLSEGQLVCVDYASVIVNVSVKLQKADWWG